MFSKINALVEKAVSSGLTQEDALAIATSKDDDLPGLFTGADILRRRFFGNQVQFCAIVNAKSGRCDQDCLFCAQSAHYPTAIELYDFLDKETICSAAKSARSFKATEFSVVTSGKGLRGANLDKAVESVRSIAAIEGLRACASVGVLSYLDLLRFKEAGLTRYHHNLETARSHYGAICTTRDFEENVATVRDAKRTGLSVCCGGIFGMGETPAQRVELAFELKSLGIDSVPINFLHPIPGTPLEGRGDLTPMECLRIIALFRFVLPTAQIILCGGRAMNLRSLQPLVFLAGASGLMIGNYLTTQGRQPEDDLSLVEDLGLAPVSADRGLQRKG